MDTELLGVPLLMSPCCCHEYSWTAQKAMYIVIIHSQQCWTVYNTEDGCKLTTPGSHAQSIHTIFNIVADPFC